MDLAQLGIMIFGGLAIWFVGRKERWGRWGYVLGLLSQPFWFWTTIAHQQWGLVAITAFYTYSWAQGAWNHWRPHAGASQDTRPIGQ